MTAAVLRNRSDAELVADMRAVTDVLRGLATVAGLPEDDPERQAWLARKRELLERIEGGR